MRRLPGASRPLVLCYHALTDAWAHALATRVDVFEQQIQALLRRGYQPARAEDVVAGHGRLLHVTFDDAFRSVGEGLAIVRRLSLPVTVFACTDYAENGRPLDVPELEQDVAGHARELETMTWDELRAIAADGVEVGSHTVTHAHLPSLSDVELERELNDSRRRLEYELGRRCRFLAYPYGEENPRVQDAARAAGYDAAFALPGPSGSVNPFALRRVGVYLRDNPLRFRLKTSRLAR
jgi:peptidoglycan/xylan/chitin deacetylase (PgdA/CDA1 family)